MAKVSITFSILNKWVGFFWSRYKKNIIQVEVDGMLKIIARVVQITVEDSRIHGYNVTEDDCGPCLFHLDLGFKFQDLCETMSMVFWDKRIGLTT
ncbi:BnaCnng41970D [Brassica napus]|uniref:(rape) hypothetical protein n=1 Tax=Brassica napus TaxID=3708 RepID=A0A078JEU0_BRANA|nr:unnamed protein product [Brassica napus]CDY63393.1 BnaCnng41970D [Brassica napus]